MHDRAFWWEEPPEERHCALWKMKDLLDEQQCERRAEVVAWNRLYRGESIDSVGPTDPRLRYNLVAQIVDTLQAELFAGAHPRATFITDGGDWTLQQSAKLREQLIDAQLRADRWHEGLSRLVQRDSLIAGTGHVWAHIGADGSPHIERCLPLEYMVELADGRYMAPRCTYRRRLVDRRVLAAKFDRRKNDILDSGQVPAFTPSDPEEWGMRMWTGDHDMVLVLEAVHLPSGPDAKDGRRSVVCENVTLYDGDWGHQRHPSSVLRYKCAPDGFWGMGLVEDLRSDQNELNRLLAKIQETMASVAGGWRVTPNSPIRRRQIADIPGFVVEGNPGDLEWINPTSVPPDLLNQVNAIIARAMQRAGVSEMLATANKPSGLNSGEAIRRHSDIHTKRQGPHAKDLEALQVDLADLLGSLNADIAAGGDKEPIANAIVKRGRRTMLRRIRWKEADMPANRYVTQSYPMSGLPHEPSGRVATVSEWMQAGLIDLEQSRALLDFPDLEGHNQLYLADHDAVLYAFEVMVEDGKFVPPEPFLNLQLAADLMRRSYIRATIDGVPEKRLELVRKYLKQVQRLMAPPEPVPAEAAPAAADLSQAAPDPAAVESITPEAAE